MNLSGGDLQAGFANTLGQRVTVFVWFLSLVPRGGSRRGFCSLATGVWVHRGVLFIQFGAGVYQSFNHSPWWMCPDGDVEAAPIGRSRWQAPHHAQPTKNVEFPSHVLRVALDALRDLALVEGLPRLQGYPRGYW